jgi:hypothetical protein
VGFFAHYSLVDTSTIFRKMYKLKMKSKYPINKSSNQINNSPPTSGDGRRHPPPPSDDFSGEPKKKKKK